MFNIKKCKCILVDTCQIKDIEKINIKKYIRPSKKNLCLASGFFKKEEEAGHFFFFFLNLLQPFF